MINGQLNLLRGIVTEKQYAVGDVRLRFGAATQRTGRSIRVVFDSGPFALLCET